MALPAVLPLIIITAALAVLTIGGAQCWKQAERFTATTLEGIRGNIEAMTPWGTMFLLAVLAGVVAYLTWRLT